MFRRAVFEERFDGAKRAVYGRAERSGRVIVMYFPYLLLHRTPYTEGMAMTVRIMATAVESHATVWMMLKIQGGREGLERGMRCDAMRCDAIRYDGDAESKD